MSTENPRACQWVGLPGGWTVGQLPLLGNLPGVRHAVGTRHGPGGGDIRADGPDGVPNRQSLAEAIGAEQCAFVRQVHGNTVVDADDALAGEVAADAIMTSREKVAVLGFSADCPIVLVADLVRGAVGMAHASWRGTVAGIAGELVAAMAGTYGCDPSDMQAGICPSAGPCCYEVGGDVIDAVSDAFGDSAAKLLPTRAGRTYFDMWAANARQLTAAGLSGHNIAIAGVCTICDERFFSYRREGPATGRFGCVIARV